MKKPFENKRLVALILLAVAFVGTIIAFRLFEVDFYLKFAVYLVLYALCGYKVIFDGVKDFVKEPFNENFLMLVASLGAFLLGLATKNAENFADAVAVMLLFSVGEFFEDFAEERSEKSITALVKLIPETADVLQGETEMEKPVDSIAVGDKLVLRTGDVLCCDGCIVSGSAYVDNSALTGESAPISRLTGDFVSSGGVIVSGMITVEVTAVAKESAVAKIIDSVKNSNEKKSKHEKFITKFARIYTPTVLILATLIAVIPTVLGYAFFDWAYRALNFLVVSCPCALVISVPMSFFAGVGKAFNGGIVVKGSDVFAQAVKLKVVAFDKTGTLTDGSFNVLEVVSRFDKAEVLRVAAICESASNHPIAKAILDASGKVDATGFEFWETAGRGVTAKRQEVRLYAGNRAFLEENGIAVEEEICRGTSVYVAKNGEFLGVILIGDKSRESAREAIAEFEKAGVKTLMLTGDNVNSAKTLASEIGIDEFYAELSPQDKIQKLKDASLLGKTAFVGDGINDAPVLSEADVAVAMGSGTDVAVECADVVIPDNDLKKIPRFLRIAKKTMRIVYENIIFSLAVKLFALVFSALGVLPMWLAVFCDVGVTVLATLNALRLAR